MAELIRIANDTPIKYRTFSIYYRIKTGDNKFCRSHNEIIKMPIGENRDTYENNNIKKVERYCETHNEVIDTWVIHDKYNKMPKLFQKINPITSKIYSRGR